MNLKKKSSHTPQAGLGPASQRSNVWGHNGRSKSEHCNPETSTQQQHQPPAAQHRRCPGPGGETPPAPF